MPSVSQSLQALRRFDQQRTGIPGEHLMTFGAGSALVRSAARRPGGLFKWLALAAGLALIARSLTGRDGLVKGR